MKKEDDIGDVLIEWEAQQQKNSPRKKIHEFINEAKHEIDLEEGKYSDTEDEHIRYEDEKKFPDDSDGNESIQDEAHHVTEFHDHDTADEDNDGYHGKIVSDKDKHRQEHKEEDEGSGHYDRAGEGEGDSEEDDDEEEEDEDESEEDDEDEKSDESEPQRKGPAKANGRPIDVKIYIQSNTRPDKQDIRGFCIAINDKGLHKIHATLKKDYKAQFSIFYREADGDIITIKSANDLKYAYRAEKQLSELNKSKHPIKLKLFAEYMELQSPLIRTRTQQSSSFSKSEFKLADSGLFDGGGIDLMSSSIHSNSSTFKGQRDLRALSPEEHNSSSSLRNSYRDGGMLFKDRLKNARFSESDNLGVVESLDTSLKSAVSMSAAGLYNEGDHVMDYEVIWKRGEVLGTGSFGQVYSGINLTNGERMAVKEVVLNPGKRHKQQAKALRQEVKILSELDHPNIVKYLGTECTDGTLRIFLELATDGTIKDALNEFGAFPEPLIRRYLVDIIEGLLFLHSKMFIHRDIKPTNLLVSNGVVKLADFGCSSQYFETESSSNAGHGTMVGTTVYMAPEVMNATDSVILSTTSPDDLVEAIKSAGSRPNSRPGSKRGGNRNANVGYGKKADIWSVGMTLIEMATGQPPFSNAGAAICAIFVSKQIPRFPAHFYEDAHHFLGRCLVELPSARANCTELRVHPFLARKSMDVIRAQTVSTSRINQYRHTTSNLRLGLPTNMSFMAEEAGLDKKSAINKANQENDVNYTTSCTMKSYNDSLSDDGIGGDNHHGVEAKDDNPFEQGKLQAQNPLSSGSGRLRSAGSSKGPKVEEKKDSYNSFHSSTSSNSINRFISMKNSPILTERSKERGHEHEFQQQVDDDDNYSDDFILEIPDTVSSEGEGETSKKPPISARTPRQRVLSDSKLAEDIKDGTTTARSPRSPRAKRTDSFSDLFYYS